jgi:hypothetical protein
VEITFQELEQAQKILEDCPGGGRGVLCRRMGISDRRARSILQKLGRATKTNSGSVKISDIRRDPPPLSQATGQPQETNEIKDDEWNVVLNGTRICTLEQLVAHCKVDLDTWEVERFVVNKWEVGAKNLAGKIEVEPLYQVKAWLKKKKAVVAAREEIDYLLKKLEYGAPVYPYITASPAPTGNLLEISIPDAHFGKLAWGQETGHENYDAKIAERLFKDAFAALLQRTSVYKFDRVLLIPGNDFLNANNNENTTANGTPQSCDGRQHKTFRTACETTIWTIERSLDIASHVDVLPIPGNHDPDAIFYLSEVLTAWFRNCDRVHIDNAPTSRKFYQWGDVGLMFTHKGGKGQQQAQRNRLLMATERRKMWGETRFNEIHTGDLHQVRLEEEFGVRVRILPSLCPPDAWHAASGYTGNWRSAEAYVWNRTDGLLSTAYYNVPEPKVA